jgi:phosphatidyl-myo-inositol alpha-mannosyltransferase
MKRNLRVALVYDDSLDRYRGVPQYVISLARGLTQRGHRVELLVGQSRSSSLGEIPVHSLSRNIRVRFNGNRLSMPLLSQAREIDRVMEDGRFDVVHVQVPYSPLMASRVISRAADSAAVVGTFHVASEKVLPRVGSRLLASVTLRSLRRFDAMMSVSRCAARFAHSYYGIDSHIVPNMVDVDFLRSNGRDGGCAGASTVAYVGALVHRKGPDLLVEAVLRLRRSRPEVTLVVAGEGPLRGKLERMVEAAGAGSSIRLVGEVGERRKAELLGAAQVACFPSRYGESFGIVLLEGIAAGAGVVLAGDNHAYSELFAACPGALCPVSPTALARRLEQLLDPRRRAPLRAAQETLLDSYRMEDITEQVLGVYADALRGRLDASRVMGLPVDSAEVALA